MVQLNNILNDVIILERPKDSEKPGSAFHEKLDSVRNERHFGFVQ